MDFSKISPTLHQLEDGIWTSGDVSRVSFPDTGFSTRRSVEEQSFWFRHRVRCISGLCSRHLANKQILEIGGGNGFIALGLQNAGLDTIMLEPGAEGIANARDRGINKLIHASFEDAAFTDASLPNIGLFDVLEHIDDDKRFLQELNRTLHPGGKLILTVPTHQLLWSHHDEFVGHVRRYRLSQLVHLLESLGFKIEYSTYFFTFLVLPIFFLRALPWRLGISTEKGGKNRAQTSYRPQTPLWQRWLMRFPGLKQDVWKKAKAFPLAQVVQWWLQNPHN